MDIRRLGPGDIESMMGASSLFDEPARREWASLFLTREGHHMLIAYIDDASAGFVSGVEMTHPDKGTEMFLYELGVAEDHRRGGVGRALVTALGQLAAERGCYGMWVGTEPDNVAAIATYQAGGAKDLEQFVTLSWSFPAR
ncbi:MAG: GNAT family N-acetyltransferase [Actinomycetota bacterium]|nr:GNAT family N-acetyltransferase [Actinomycetota bacterium]